MCTSDRVLTVEHPSSDHLHPKILQQSAMSSLVRSFASLYCQKLRSTTRLGPVTAAPPRFEALNRRGLSDARPPPALPMPSQQSQSQQQKRTPFFTWARFAVGSILAAATPFLHSRWASFLRIQSEVEMVKDTAEALAEVVEEAATVAEKVSSEVAEQVPENGRLRAAAVLVERASKEVAEEAHVARDIIHKVDEIEEDVKAILNHSKHAHAETGLTAQQSIKTEGNQKKGKDF